jgi:hypothetical protein
MFVTCRRFINQSKRYMCALLRVHYMLRSRKRTAMEKVVHIRELTGSRDSSELNGNI